MTHVTKTAVLGLIGVLATLGGAPPVASGAPDSAPRVVMFSPAAVHAGDAFIIDAEFAGRRPPRVWVGPYRVARSRVHVDAQETSSGSRRIWGRVPARVPSGEHFLKIATRAGAAVAAKPVQVASCGTDPVTPGTPVDLTVSGSNSYKTPIRLANAPVFVTEPSDPDKSSIAICGDDGKFRCLTIQTTTQARAEIHVGTVTTLGLFYYDGQSGSQWTKEPGGSVKVVEATPTSVRLSFDNVLTFKGTAPAGVPKTVTVKGSLEFKR